MTKYSKTHNVNLTVPNAIYEDILVVIGAEQRWLSPQQFILEALNEKIEKWKEAHQTSGVVHKKT